MIHSVRLVLDHKIYTIAMDILTQKSTVKEYKQSKSLPAIDGYEFIHEIGHGSQGDVWLARRKSDQKKVAIKRLNIGSIKNWKEYELFQREAKVLSTLNIDGVATFYEAIDRLDDNPPCAYIVQDYIEGQTLSNFIHAGHRFSINRIYDIFLQILDILQQLHTHEPPVIHRDLKPSNVLIKQVDGKDKVYLIDFGAVANPQVQSGGSTIAGTYGYMPPEQLMGNAVPKSDIYALAALMIHLITGIAPVDLPHKDFHLIFEPEMQNMPVAVVNTLRSMLEPNTKMRLCDYGALRTLFTNFKKNIYTETGSRQKPMPIADYNKKLRQVSNYGQPGNIELWQELPDHLPRYKDKPTHAYFKLRLNHFQTDGFPIFPIKKKSYFSPSSNVETVIVCIVFSVLISISILSFVIFLQTHHGNIEMLIYYLIVLPSLMFISLGVACISPELPDILINTISSKRYKLKHRLSLPNEGHAMVQTYIKDLIQNGRKTIATIVSVEYQEIEARYVETNPVQRKDCIQKYYHRSPLFKIVYKFNPPDDEKAEEIVHHIYTHLSPENNFKAGDPLPILYRIYNDNHHLEVVDSMPYPLPLDDIGDLSNAVCHLENDNK